MASGGVVSADEQEEAMQDEAMEAAPTVNGETLGSSARGAS